MAAPAQLAVDVFEEERRRLELAAVELRQSLAEKDVLLTERSSEAALEEAKVLQGRYDSEMKERKAQADELQQRLQSLGASLQRQAEEMKGTEEELLEAEDYESDCLRRQVERQELQSRSEKIQAEDGRLVSRLRSEIRLADSRTSELQLELRETTAHTQKAVTATNDTRDGMTLQEQIAADLKGQLCESQETVAGLEESVQAVQSLCSETEERIEEMLQDSTIEDQAVRKDEDNEARAELLDETRKLDETRDKVEQVQKLQSIAQCLAAELRKSGRLVSDTTSTALPVTRSEVLEGLLSEEHELQAEFSACRLDAGRVEVQVKHLEEELEQVRNKVQEDEVRTAQAQERRSLSICERQSEELRARLSKLHSKDSSAVVGSEDALKKIMLTLEAKGRRLLLQKQAFLPTEAETRRPSHLYADT